MRGLVAALCLVGTQAGADCVDVGAGFAEIEGAYELRQENMSVVLVLEPNSRAPRTIRFTLMDTLGYFNGDILDNGMKFVFQTRVEDAEGSGGPVATLQGTLADRFWFDVICTMQAEDPDPEWCVPLLGKLRRRVEGCTKVGE